jgi:hypothetical protein
MSINSEKLLELIKNNYLFSISFHKDEMDYLIETDKLKLDSKCIDIDNLYIYEPKLTVAHISNAYQLYSIVSENNTDLQYLINQGTNYVINFHTTKIMPNYFDSCKRFLELNINIIDEIDIIDDAVIFFIPYFEKFISTCHK